MQLDSTYLIQRNSQPRKIGPSERPRMYTMQLARAVEVLVNTRRYSGAYLHKLLAKLLSSHLRYKHILLAQDVLVNRLVTVGSFLKFYLPYYKNEENLQ